MYCINENCKNFAIFENKRVVKSGRSQRSGAQKYLCRDCGKLFQEFDKITKDYSDKKAKCFKCGSDFICKSRRAKYCDTCQSLMKSEWDKKGYVKFREKIILYVKKYAEKNREKILLKKKQYYIKNKKRFSEYSKKKHAEIMSDENKRNELNKKARETRSKKPELYREIKNRWALKNKEKIKETYHKKNVKHVNELTDYYIKNQLKKAGYDNPTIELMGASRARLALKRELKKWEEKENDIIQRDGRKQSKAYEPSHEESVKS